MGPGHDNTCANRKPDSEVDPYTPARISCAVTAWHLPVVGGALNWHGQPQAQLHVTTPSPAMRHLVLTGSLIIDAHHKLLRNLISLYRTGATVKQSQRAPTRFGQVSRRRARIDSEPNLDKTGQWGPRCHRGPGANETGGGDSIDDLDSTSWTGIT